MPQRCQITSYVDVNQYRLANTFDLGDDAFEVERLGKNDFEDLLDVDRGRC